MPFFLVVFREVGRLRERCLAGVEEIAIAMPLIEWLPRGAKSVSVPFLGSSFLKASLPEGSSLHPNRPLIDGFHAGHQQGIGAATGSCRDIPVGAK